jgi:hypothetical protein
VLGQFVSGAGSEETIEKDQKWTNDSGCTAASGRDQQSAVDAVNRLSGTTHRHLMVNMIGAGCIATAVSLVVALA